ncbi:MAG TPA: anti-sigma factor [Gemmatimonadales bacterium]|nr:anti-sigma factor [Gemmatimonadales bacterium]
MTPHDWYVENRAAWVSRALEPREERLFDDHLPRCEECRQEVARLERELGWLPMAAVPAAPRPGLTRELADSVLRRRSWWRRHASGLAAAAAVALAAALGYGEHRRRAEVESLLAERERRLLAVEDTLSVMRRAARVVQREIAMGEHRGGLLIFRDEISHRWNVVMHGLPAAPPGTVYQFWFVTETGMVRSVELRCEDDKPAFATLEMPATPAPVMGAALTVEPALNRSGEPKGPELVHVDF